ncbi:ankyrin repeat domain-containing protein [Mucilaginibacter limnophilus]|uniref:Ankyrin repeat domain-containing protein n=1 Tax=Mucilaginibacter limnophilus TaxID=1932778 RepID=A0A3S2UJA4_9SPHI|nr:ankyrin repeat domain-containing protein [Mucilaginibacter limnophilus]RVT96573.1 ankyrin repeat domain-containing protein [Mucilaginibacter limnophilus]
MSTDLLEQYIAQADLVKLNELLTANPALGKVRTSHNVSPVMLSCYYKKPEVTELLLKHVTDINLFEAAASGKFDVVTYTITTHPEAIDYYSEDGFTPLGLASYFGQLEVARYLVMRGANVNLPSNNGYNVFPLHSAAAGDFTNIAVMLIENGAEVNVRQQAGVTPLHSAAQNGNVELLIALLEHGAAVDIRMEGGKLPADLAKEKGFNDIAEILGFE